MFDEPPSLPMHAAMASLLGGLFGIGLILSTHTVQAQGADPAAASGPVAEDSSALIRRIGNISLRSLRGAEPALDSAAPGARGLRIGDNGNPVDSGLRWQVARLKGLRSEGEAPRNRDLISVGVQVRF